MRCKFSQTILMKLIRKCLLSFFSFSSFYISGHFKPWNTVHLRGSHGGKERGSKAEGTYTPGKWPETKRVPRKIKTVRRGSRTKGWAGEGEKAGWILATAATRNRARRGQDKDSAPDSSTGQEGTITLQDYLPEMFFHPLDTRGFFNYNYNETVEFQNILQGKIQPGDNVHRLKEDQEDVSDMDLCQLTAWYHHCCQGEWPTVKGGCLDRLPKTSKRYFAKKW